MGSYPMYVPVGTTSVSQPLDVDIVGAFKTRPGRLYAEVSALRCAYERQHDMFIRTLTDVKEISSVTIVFAFPTSNPFLPVPRELTPDVQGSLTSFRYRPDTMAWGPRQDTGRADVIHAT